MSAADILKKNAVPVLCRAALGALCLTVLFAVVSFYIRRAADWLDCSHVWFSVLRIVFFAFFALSALAPAAQRVRGEHGGRFLRALSGDALFFIALLLTLAVCRIPAVMWPSTLNPDEASFLTGAMALARSPVPWGSMNPFTTGPLHYCALAVLSWLGQPLDYFNARVLGLFLLSGALFFSGRALGCFMGRTQARLALVPALLLLCFVQIRDFLSFSSEVSSVFAGALLIWLLALAAVRRGAGYFFLAGLAAGALPLIKIQAAPLALLFAAALGALALLGRRGGQKARLTSLAAAGCAALPALTLALVTLTGNLRFFFEAFIMSNFGYARHSSSSGAVIIPKLEDVWDSFFYFDGMTVYIFCSLTLALTSFLAAAFPWLRKKLSRERVFWALFAAAWLAVSFYTAFAPGKFFAHYMVFLIPPLGCAPFLFLSLLIRRPARDILLVVFLMIFGGLTLFFFAADPNIFIRPAHYYDRSNITALSKFIKGLGFDGAKMCVWGWMPQYHVETGIPQGARDHETHGIYDQWNSSRKDYFIGEYLRDLRKNRPEIFIDAVTSGSFMYSDKSKYGPETAEPVFKYVTENYSRAAEIDGNIVYVAKDKTIPPPALTPAFDCSKEDTLLHESPERFYDILNGRPGKRNLTASSGDFSVHIVFYPERPQPVFGGALITNFNKGKGFDVSVLNSEDKIFVAVALGLGDAFAPEFLTLPLDPGRPHYIVLSRGGGRAEIFADGARVAGAAFSRYASGSGDPLCVGSSADPDRALNGKIYEVMILNRPSSPGETRRLADRVKEIYGEK
jgi:hypothetical protein